MNLNDGPKPQFKESAIIHMANQSGGSLKEPAEPAAKPAAKK